MLERIHVNEELYKNYHLPGAENFLEGLSKINIFIGQNNSGKSRFLRNLFVDDTFEFDLQKNVFQNVLNILNTSKLEIRKTMDSQSVVDADNIYADLEKLITEIGRFKKGKVKEYLSKIRQLANRFNVIREIQGAKYTGNYTSTTDGRKILKILNKTGHEIIEILDEYFPDEFDYSIEKIYIPILRGLRPLQLALTHGFNEDNYVERTIKDYFSDVNEKKKNEIKTSIYSGISFYNDTKTLLLGNKQGRDKIKSFERFLSSNIFQGQEVTLIPDIQKDVLLIGIGVEERHVYELGDGIQSIIILLYPLFFNQEKKLVVFIEEPENFLHPGMQRVFLETLMKEEFKNCQFFITSHSNHFLDITLDSENISIYSFQKSIEESFNTPIFKIDNVSNADIRVLDLIGARTSSVFLSNCTIWVEGITDRLYLKKYLDVYQEYLVRSNLLKVKFKEDINYSFVEYGGGNIVHWSFINEEETEKIDTSKISSKIFIVADKDSTNIKTKSEKAQRLNKLQEKLQDRIRVLDAVEIENILGEKVIIQTVKQMEKANVVNVTYNENKITFSKYRHQKLGTFI